MGGDSPLCAFPRASDIASLRPHDLRALGFSSSKSSALLELASRVESGLDLEALADLDDDRAIEQLQTLRGVGRWTAEYVLLRGLGRLELFPGDDVGARTNLARRMRPPTFWAQDGGRGKAGADPLQTLASRIPDVTSGAFWL